MKNVLVRIYVYAEGYYSGAVYEENVDITLTDYIKLFGLEGVSPDKLEKLIIDTWEGQTVGVGELDGKHSDVEAEIGVDFWTIDEIRHGHYDNPQNTGEYLINCIAEKCGVTGYKEQQNFKNNITKNTMKLVDELTEFVSVSYMVPKNKVEEINKYIEEVCKTEV